MEVLKKLFMTLKLGQIFVNCENHFRKTYTVAHSQARVLTGLTCEY